MSGQTRTSANGAPMSGCTSKADLIHRSPHVSNVPIGDIPSIPGPPSATTYGTYVPVEEPSTASTADRRHYCSPYRPLCLACIRPQPV
jgi:hypothetical protein